MSGNVDKPKSADEPILTHEFLEAVEETMERLKISRGDIGMRQSIKGKSLRHNVNIYVEISL